MKHTFTILLITLGVFFAGDAHGLNPKDSVAQVLSRMSLAYHKGTLSEKAYLDTVHITMRDVLSLNILFTNKELLNMLEPYRQVIWKGKNNEAHKRNYYAILCNQAQIADRGGEVLYYAGKFDKLERGSRNRPSLTALSLITVYYDGLKAYGETKALYQKEKKYLQSIPHIAVKEKLDQTDLVQAAILMEEIARALYELKDTLLGKETEDILAEIAAVNKAKYKEDPDVTTRIAIAQLFAFYQGAAARVDKEQLLESFRRMETMLADKNTPEFMRFPLYAAIADAKTAYYIHYADVDSAAHYLGIYEEIAKEGQDIYNKFVVDKYRARLLYTAGKYKESADTYEKAMNVLDSSRSLVEKDINDMMYARAEGEEKQLLLAESEAQNRKSEKRLLVAIAAAAILLVGGLFIIQYIRRKQKNRLLEFKLNMARNIHDETNPALLYATALLKASRSAENGEQASVELEHHISHTMQLIRSLSHDLKSDKQYTLQDLVSKTTQTLEKLNMGSDFTFTIHADIDKKRFISHYQYTQLTSVLNECITNSIKHASFDKISLSFANNGHKLTITYSDNGKGWEIQQPAAGIGVKNMKERVKQINGEWKIVNNYPNGYQIVIATFLR